MSTNKTVFSKACALALTGAFVLTGCTDDTQAPASMPNQTPATGTTNKITTYSTDPLVSAAQQATNSAVEQAQQNLETAAANNTAAQNNLTTIVSGATKSTSTKTTPVTTVATVPTTTAKPTSTTATTPTKAASPTATKPVAATYTLAQYEAAKKAATDAQVALTKATNDYNTAVANRDKLNTAVAKAESQLAAEDPTYETSTPIDWNKVDQDTTARVVESIVYAKVNEYRMNQGLPALAYTKTGSAETLDWCKTMAANGKISHADLKKANASAENVLQTYYGEGVLIQDPKHTNADGSALIYDNKDAEDLANDIFQLWKNSEGHDHIFLLGYTESMAISVYFAGDDKVYSTLREYASYNARTDLSTLPDPAEQYGITTVAQDTVTRGAYTGALQPSNANYTVGVTTTDLTPNLHATTTVENTRYNELESQVKVLKSQQAAAEAEVTKTKAAKDDAQADLTAANVTVAKMESGVLVGGIEAEPPAGVETEAAATATQAAAAETTTAEAAPVEATTATTATTAETVTSEATAAAETTPVAEATEAVVPVAVEATLPE